MSDTTVGYINLTDSAMLTEDELLDRAREGDRTAFGTLYLRHRDAARKVAGMCASSGADADDAVAEGFARVFAALPRMAGRTIAFRPYLLTCVRNAATDRLRRERRVDLRETMPETPAGVQADDVALLGLERNLVGEALQALPSRWRTVLWLTEVEGLSPAEVSRRIGIKPNAVAALAYRARKGLREAYLQAHLRAEAGIECRATVSRLGNYVRGELPERDRLGVQAHLDDCAKCRCRRDELTDVNATLRNALLPVPLLLAGMERNWFSFSQIGGQWWARVPEIASATQAVDSPMLPKALAGVAMAVLALTGTAVPHAIDERPRAVERQAEVAAAARAPGRTTLDVSPVTARVVELAVQPVDAAASVAAAPAAMPPAAATEETDASPVRGGTRHSLFPGSGDRSGSTPDRRGDTRQRLLDPPPGGGGGLLDTAPVIGLLDSTLQGLGLGDVLPFEVHVSVSPLGGTAEGGSLLGVTVGADPIDGLDIGISTTAPAAATPAATSPASPTGSLLTDIVDPVLAPVVDVVDGLSR